MPKIMISYRRDDSEVITGRIFDRLVTHYGPESIFHDIDNMPLGADFREHIDAVLNTSDIVIAVVGPKWVGPRAGQNRLANAADPVRVEIEAALGRSVPLIPILVLRAKMPRVDQLPPSIQDFAYRNATQIASGQDFDMHIARLIRSMDKILEEKAAQVEEARKAEEERQAAEDEAQQRAEVARLAKEGKQRVEAAWRAEEEKQRAEAARQAEEEKLRAEATGRAAKEKQRAEAARRDEEVQQRAEQERQLAEARGKAEDARVGEARRRAEEKERAAEVRRKTGDGHQPADAARKREEEQKAAKARRGAAIISLCITVLVTLLLAVTYIIRSPSHISTTTSTPASLMTGGAESTKKEVAPQKQNDSPSHISTTTSTPANLTTEGGESTKTEVAPNKQIDDGYVYCNYPTRTTYSERGACINNGGRPRF